MAKKIIFIGLAAAICLALAFFFRPRKWEAIKSIPPFQKGERVLILAPHPDDEAIACAGVIQEALTAAAEVQVAYLTSGDHNQFGFIVYKKRPVVARSEFIRLGRVRMQEAVKAMKSLGLDERNLVFLGYPDFGTLSIFEQYWQTGIAHESMLTRISRVPYEECISFNAAYTGENILADLEKVILDYQPRKIFVSHPADTNPDHKALYLFLQVALSDLRKQIPAPQIFPYLVHHRGWPLPRHYRPHLYLEPPEEFSDSEIRWGQFKLSAAQLQKKYRAILTYRSQTASSAFYLLAFARQNELFSEFPQIRLKAQGTEKEKEAAFFGFSRLFPSSPFDEAEGLEALVEEKEGVSYAVVENFLLIRIEKPESSVRRLSSMIYLFGYSYKTPFAKMPKLRIATLYNRFRIFDKRKPVGIKGAQLEVDEDCLILKIPLEVLGNPDYILTSVKLLSDSSTIDASAFRKVVIGK